MFKVKKIDKLSNYLKDLKTFNIYWKKGLISFIFLSPFFSYKNCVNPHDMGLTYLGGKNQYRFIIRLKPFRIKKEVIFDPISEA